MMINVREAQAGPALNAACAKALGWEVAWLHCQHNPECRGVDVDIFRQEPRDDTYYAGLLPCYVYYWDDGTCACSDDDDTIVAGHSLLCQRIVAGHSVLCYRPVPFFSEWIDKAWELVEAMCHAAWDVCARAVVAMPDECSVYKTDEGGTEIEILGFADTVELAIARAFLLAHDITEIEEAKTEIGT